MSTQKQTFVQRCRSSIHNCIELSQTAFVQLGLTEPAVYAMHPNDAFVLVSDKNESHLPSLTTNQVLTLIADHNLTEPSRLSPGSREALATALQHQIDPSCILIPFIVDNCRARHLHDDDSGLVVGFALASSIPETTPASSDLTSLSPFAQTAAGCLYGIYCEELLAWHASAQRTLGSASHAILSNSLWFASTDPRAAFPHTRHLLSSQQQVSLLRKRIAERAIRILRTGLQLDRCAILTPLDDAPEFWYYLHHSGYPDDLLEKKNYYIRGQGLTGRVLNLTRRDSPIESTDVEGDFRWSLAGSSLQRKPVEEGPMAFLGIPVFSHFSKTEVLPYAALNLLPLPKQPLFFTKNLQLGRNATSRILPAQLSYGFDVLRWREDEEGRLVRQLQLSRIWSTQISEKRKLERALAVLADEGPFRRILLSLVSDDREWITGAAASGFRERLVKDTVRRIYRDCPSSPGDEDILARIVRLSITDTIRGRSREPNDEWYPFVNRFSADRNRVRNKIHAHPSSACGAN